MAIEEHVARELLHYFTGQHPTGVRYDDMPEDVKELWIGAARVAIKAIQERASGCQTDLGLQANLEGEENRDS